MIFSIDFMGPKSDMFFISILTSENESLAFDWTSKAHRIVKQKLIAQKIFPNDVKPTLEWDTYVLDGSKILEKRHTKWLDKGRRDQINDKVWEMVWAKPLSKETAVNLLRYSNLICSNIDNLKQIEKEIKELESLIKLEMSKLEV